MVERPASGNATGSCGSLTEMQHIHDLITSIRDATHCRASITKYGYPK
jgi:hypothetical protein